MQTRRPIAVIAAALSLALLPALAPRADLLEISELFVFGDSLSDGGSGDPSAVFPPPPYAGGRSSNGLTAVEQFWNLYGDGGLQPSLAGGTNFAIGGATTGLESFNEVNSNVPEPLQPAFAEFSAAWELQQFLAHPAASTFDPATSLFVIWLFPNDLFYFQTTNIPPGTVVPGLPGVADPVTNAIANIVAMIQILAGAGAQHFLVPNLANLANTPAFTDSDQAALVSQISALFNDNLAAQLAALDAQIGADITLFDTDALFQDVFANPGAYGLTNTTDACVDNLANGLCNPREWLFWDGVHPTARTHEILAHAFGRALVREPGSLAMFGLGLLALGVVRSLALIRAERRRRQALRQDPASSH